MKVHRMTTIRFLATNRILAAAEDTPSVAAALADVEEADRDKAKLILLDGRSVTIHRDFGSTRIHVRLVPAHATARGLKKEKV